jgi:hypothetical protein
MTGRLTYPSLRPPAPDLVEAAGASSVLGQTGTRSPLVPPDQPSVCDVVAPRSYGQCVVRELAGHVVESGLLPIGSPV